MWRRSTPRVTSCWRTRRLRGRVRRLPVARADRVQLGARLVRRDRRAATTARRCGSSRRTARNGAGRSPRCPTGPTGWRRGCGRRACARGDRLILMLGNQVELWETILAAMKLGAVLIPATPLLGPADLRDRLERGNARHVVVGSASTDKFADVAGDYTRIAVGVRCGRLAAVRRRRTTRTAGSGPTAPPAPTTRCCSTSPPAPRRARSSSSTRTRRTRSAICPRCTGSACARATYT